MDNVIVVGAGPVGLWTAIELRLAGVAVTVVEREPGRRAFTRALGIHARTVEVLAMRGLAETPLADGRALPRWHFGMLPTFPDYSGLDTPYPFVLAYPQNALEDLLERRAVELGAAVRRGTAVKTMTQDHAGVRVELADGTTLTASWLVGADGAGSTVRKAAGIAFTGTDATLWGYVADVTLSAPPELTGTLATPDGALVVAPLPGGRFRLAGFDPRDQTPDPEMTMDRLVASVHRATGRDLGIAEASWISRFGNATRQAADYHAGRVLLAGDAAHMHMPTGGVGLNIGVQDAMNLGWKLGSVARGAAPQSLLDTYHAERAPVGAAMLANTQAQTALVTAFTPEGQALRAHLSALLDRHPAVQHDLALGVSGLDVHYPPSDPGAHPSTGRRFADPAVFPLLRDARPVLVRDPSAPPVETELAVHEAPGAAYALIRPDGHVWWATDEPDPLAAAAAIAQRWR
ncbi:2-polyprenyl-6-methoxyphenol hydroxylase-like FAD-dependent oxidoreductase [Catenuloplanes nepalensis]|uniref:2-polyprenyl-6-methoxyphenol hydroxylase-like FAD-dependent oxidoreductase n=1 Tax=Catenuloplanes nepalensis TaxID=587533 RepID=A0ABT9MY62_9ACTN|nr:FAD-dependent oxidoreductase [Catenuloplanes nepalensis]MDP9796387.1 2-polyprenyl-6-methoxyphenol hydroxylase-like FAD-dependent oxidoreductase [Catenuloplanes nepalensis]